MKQQAVIAGVGMTRFGKHLDRSLSDLAQEAISHALADARVRLDQVQAVWAGSAAAPIITGQVCIGGQAILRGLGLGQVPVINVENACATASTAFQQACSMVTLGAYDVVLAFGVEKLYHPDKARVFSVFDGCSDVERPEALAAFLLDEEGREVGAGQNRSVFMDIYARMAREYMARTGAEARHFARVSAKNSRHGALNPLAQYRSVVTEDEVLASTPIVSPLTLLMCSPLGDGAAAAVIVSPRVAAELGVARPIQVLSSLVISGYDYREGEEEPAAFAARQAYEMAGIDPLDLDCVELHDASSPAELIHYEALKLCKNGDSLKLLDEGATALGGKVPVNTSGGLVRKGHPIGATGLAQIYELTQQLRGCAGERQVEGARLAAAENGGGFLRNDAAAIAMTILAS